MRIHWVEFPCDNLEHFKTGTQQAALDLGHAIATLQRRTRVYLHGGAGMLQTQAEIDGKGR
jgi:hypothetical protein